MPKVTKILQSFNAGELSPLMDCRIYQEKYQMGCRIMENFYPLIYGGAERRPGTYFVNEVKDSNSKTRIVPFEYNVEQAYILEFGNQYIRFYRNGGLIVGALLASTAAWADATAYVIGDFVSYSSVIYRCIRNHTSATGGGDGAGGEPDTNTTQWIVAALTSDSYPIYEIVSPYLTADLFELKLYHSNDVLWITHTDYEPRKLSRTTSTTWTLTEEAFADGPFIDENDDTTKTITITGTLTKGSSVTLTANSALFTTGTTAGHAPSGTAPTSKSLTGALFRICHAITSSNVDKTFTTTGNSSTLKVYKGVKWDFVTNGTWKGTIILERSYDNEVTYETVHTITSENNANCKVDMTETVNDALYRMRCSAMTGGSANCQLSVRDHNHIGVVEITAVASTTSATATVMTTLASANATHRWSEGYWSNKRGWPSCVTISPEERLTYAGSITYPLTIWGSVIGDYTSMKEGVLDDDAVIFTLVGQGKQNAIRWIISKNSLLVGTAGGEYILGSSNEDEPITPTNIQAKVQCTYGSADIQALVVNDCVIFVQRGGRKIRELRYSFENDSYQADDLTVFSNHITESGITQIDFQRTPDPMLWCVRTDGQIAIMSYEREQNIFSWSRIVTRTAYGNSVVESIAITSGIGEEDIVWIIVKRIINGQTKRYVEYFAPRNF